MDLDDAIDRAITLEVVEPSRCRAKSKQSGVRCKNRPEPGVTKCRMHGGKTEGRPNQRMITHGLTSAYIPKDKLPAIFARVEELRSREGKESALLAMAAETERRLGNVPETAENAEVFTKVAKSIREDLKLADELTRDQAPAQAPVIVVGNYSTDSPVFASRTLEGMVTIHVHQGAPYILDEATGALWPAIKRVDESTGADYYERILALPAAR